MRPARRSNGGKKEQGDRGEVKKPWKFCHEGAACRTRTSNRDASAVAMLLSTSPDIESRTGLICNYNMASEDASPHYSLPEPLITVRLGSYTVPT